MGTDGEHPPSPRERASEHQNRNLPRIDGVGWSRRLVPRRIRTGAISVSLTPRKTEYVVGEPVQFAVTMENRLPIPVTLATETPILWTWSVDGADEGSEIPLHDPPDERRGFVFERSERKQFLKTWNGLFQVSEHEWERPATGTHRLRARVNTADPAADGLVAEAEITLVPE